MEEAGRRKKSDDELWNSVPFGSFIIGWKIEMDIHDWSKNVAARSTVFLNMDRVAVYRKAVYRIVRIVNTF